MGSNRTRARQSNAARLKEQVASKSPLEQHQDVTAANTERILRALDDFANPAARLGVGSSNLLEGTQYPLTRITRLYMLMQSLYRSNWVAQRIADTYPELMCKVPPVLTCQEKPEDLDKFYRIVEKYQVWAKLEWTMKLANVFGGAGAVIIIDGHENFLDEPLDLDDVKPDSFRGLTPFDRWSGISPGGNICNDVNRPLEYGLPESYQVTTATGGMFNVHASRVMRFTGKDLQLWEQQSEMWWGESLFEAAWEEIKKRDNMSFNIVSLMFRAQILGLKIPGLEQIISGVSMPGPAAQQFQRTLQAQSDLMSNQGLAVFGKDGGFESHQYTFGGMSEIYHELMKDVAASAEIPYEVLFGRDSGLGASGETSLQILYDRTGHKQKTKVHPQLQKLYPVIAMSVWGEVPDDFGWKFPSPRTMSNKDQAELADALTKPVIEAFNAGLISQKTALMELQQNADVTEVFSNITDEDVSKADAEVAKPMELGGGEEAGQGFGSGSEEGQGEQGKAGSPHSKQPRPAGGEDRATDAYPGGEQDAGRWVTLPNNEHIHITNGVIDKGPSALTGKSIVSLKQEEKSSRHEKSKKLVTSLHGKSSTTKTIEHPKFAAKVKDVVEDYQGGHYRWINEVLKGQRKLKTKREQKEADEFANTLSTAIQSSKATAPMKLYRGVKDGDVLLDMVPGDTSEAKGFLSTSTNKSIASRFVKSADGRQGVTMEIHAAAGKPMLSVEAATGINLNDENEVLLDHASKYRVIAVDKKTRTIQVELL